MDGLVTFGGVATEVRTLDADAAVGFERSVVILLFGFSSTRCVGAFLDRARDAAVGA